MESSVSRSQYRHSRNSSDMNGSPRAPVSPSNQFSSYSPSSSLTFAQQDAMERQRIEQLGQTVDALQSQLEAGFHDIELVGNTVEAFQETLHQASVQSILANSPENTTPQTACETSENLLRTLIPALRAQTHVFDGETKGKVRTALGKLNRLVVQLLREKAELMLGNIITVQSQGKKGDVSKLLESAISKEELSRELNTLTERHEAISSQYLQAEEMNVALRDQLAAAREEIADLESSLQVKDEKILIAHRQQAHAKRDMKTLAQEVTSLRDRISQLETDHAEEVANLTSTFEQEVAERINDVEQFRSHSETLETVAQFFDQSVTNATMEMLTVTCPAMNMAERCELSNKTLSELAEGIDEKNQSLQEFSDAPATIKAIGDVIYHELTQRIRLTKLLNISCWTEIQVGDYIMLSDGRTGECKYVGEIDGKVGQWYGIELALPVGQHNGTLNGRKYFRAPHNCGVFVLRNRILRVLEQKGDMVKVSNRDLQRLQGRLIKLERAQDLQLTQIKALETIRTNLSEELLMMSQQHQSLLDQNESMMSLNKHLKVKVREFLKMEAEKLRGVVPSASEPGFSRSAYRSETFDESSRGRGTYGGNLGGRSVIGGRSATIAYDPSFDESVQDRDYGYQSS